MLGWISAHFGMLRIAILMPGANSWDAFVFIHKEVARSAVDWALLPYPLKVSFGYSVLRQRTVNGEITIGGQEDRCILENG